MIIDQKQHQQMTDKSINVDKYGTIEHKSEQFLIEKFINHIRENEFQTCDFFDCNICMYHGKSNIFLRICK